MGNVAVGKKTSINIEKVSYPIIDFNLDSTTELNESSHGGSAGHREYDVGFDGATGTIVANYDPTDNPIPKIADGQSFEISYFVPAADRQFSITLSAIANGLSFKGPVKGLVSFVISFTANGWNQSTLKTIPAQR